MLKFSAPSQTPGIGGLFLAECTYGNGLSLARKIDEAGVVAYAPAIEVDGKAAAAFGQYLWTAPAVLPPKIAIKLRWTYSLGYVYWLSDAEINDIKLQEAEEWPLMNATSAPRPYIAPGTKIAVLAGPFVGMKGTMLRDAGESCKVSVNICTVWMPAFMIAPQKDLLSKPNRAMPALAGSRTGHIGPSPAERGLTPTLQTLAELPPRGTETRADAARLVSNTPMPGTRIDDIRLCELWDMGRTRSEIAAEIGASKAGVCFALKRLGKVATTPAEILERYHRTKKPKPAPKPAPRYGYATVEAIMTEQGVSRTRALQIFHKRRT